MAKTATPARDPRVIHRSTIEAFGGEATFRAACDKLRAQREEARRVEGAPAPAGHPLVEEVMDRFDGQFVIEEPPAPPARPTMEQKAIDAYARLSDDHEAFVGRFAALEALVNQQASQIEFLTGELARAVAGVEALEAKAAS